MFWHFEKISTNSWLMAIFSVFTFLQISASAQSKNSNFFGLKLSVRTKNVFRLGNFLELLPGKILVFARANPHENGWRRPLVATTWKQKMLALMSSMKKCHCKPKLVHPGPSWAQITQKIGLFGQNLGLGGPIWACNDIFSYYSSRQTFFVIKLLPPEGVFSRFHAGLPGQKPKFYPGGVPKNFLI